MKKIFKFAAVAAMASLALVSCNKQEKTPDVTPVNPDQGDTHTWDEIVDINVDYDYTLGYSGVALDYADYKTDKGNYIWEVFGFNSEADFIAALGSDDISNGVEQSSDATVKFGAIDGSTEYLNETGSTTNGWGHWFSAVGDVVSWGDNSAFFTEGYYIENQSLAITFGSKPDIITAANVGNTYSVIDCFYDDDNTVAVRINAKVIAPEVHELTVVGQETQEFNVDPDDEYTGYVIDVEDAIATLGLSDANVKVYGVNPDGTYSVTAGKNFWFMADGTIGSWGEGAGICINDDSATGNWTWCMFPGVENTTATGTVAFVNDDYEAYVITVKANIAEAKPERYVEVMIDATSEDWREDFIFDVEGDLTSWFGMTVEDILAANENGQITTWAEGQKFALCDSAEEAYDMYDWNTYMYVGAYYGCENYPVDYPYGLSLALAYGKVPGTTPVGAESDFVFPITYTPEEGDPVTFTYYINIKAVDPSDFE